MAKLVTSLIVLRAEFNDIAPDRDTESDGWIGDAAHQAEKSDHNPDGRGLVHAIDVDTDLRMPGLTMSDVVDFLVARCKSGVEDRLTYIIYYRTIWERSNKWRPRPYTGKSPHTEHAHFSADDSPARESDNSPWRLEKIPMALTADDKTWISKEIAKQIDAGLTAYAAGDGDTTGRKYSRDGLATTTEQDTKLIRAALKRIEEHLIPPA